MVLPGIDLLNHNPNASLMTDVYEVKKITANKDYQPGEEVFLSYGELNDNPSRKLGWYGWLEYNITAVTVQYPEVLPFDRNSEPISDLLDQLGWKNRYIGQGDSLKEMMTFACVHDLFDKNPTITVNEVVEKMATSNTKYGCYSMENEQRAIESVKNAFTKHLETLKATLAEDEVEKLEQNQTIPLAQKAAMTFKLGERKVAQYIIDTLSKAASI